MKQPAYYLRLSRDDDGGGESSSIAGQREIIREYMRSSGEFNEAQTLEFVDDGYSGTDFNRPKIKQLLDAVKKGEVDCIIVKDFSRFGRNYLEVSKYIEQLFPYIGVRFIAVNDNYDSIRHKGAAAEIDVPVRNMINAMYSRDISKKMKSAKLTKNKQGIFSNAYTIYGYKKNTADKGELLIDEPAAVVVRRIFQLSLDGVKFSKIAERLNSERIPTPSEHKNNAGNKRNWLNINEGHGVWTLHSVCRIIKDERYTGTFVGGMRESGLGNNKQTTKPKEEWIRIPDNHPAVITREQFDAANKMTREYIYTKRSAKKNSHKPLYKKVWCGNCGHRLRYRGNDAGRSYYFCDTVKYSDGYGCMRGKIYEKELDEAVRSALLTQIKIFTANARTMRTDENIVKKPDIQTDKSVSQLENKIKKLQSDKRKLYEGYKNGKVDRILYLQKREILISQQKNHENTLESKRRLYEKRLECQPAAEFTKELADEFIESVHVYEADRIKIRFTFKDNTAVN